MISWGNLWDFDGFFRCSGSSTSVRSTVWGSGGRTTTCGRAGRGSLFLDLLVLHLDALKFLHTNKTMDKYDKSPFLMDKSTN